MIAELTGVESVTLQHFLPLKGQRFELQAEGIAPWAAELVEANSLPGAVGAGRQPFSLLFKGPPAPVLPQRIYRVAHQAMPAMDIFLVPVRAGSDGVCYEAVFG